VLAPARNLRPEDYGATLLKTLSLLRHPLRDAPNSVAMASSKSVFISRIKTISEHRAPSAWLGMAGFVLLAGFLVFLTTNRVTGETSGSPKATFVLPINGPSRIEEEGGPGAGISTPEQSRMRLYCIRSPDQIRIERAHPETFEALYQPVLLRALDEHGEGIEWSAAHWLEVHDPPTQGDSAALPATYEFRATAHLAVLRSFWTYEKTDHGKFRKKEWVLRTVAHVTAGGAGDGAPVLRASAWLDAKGKLHGSSLEDAQAFSNAGQPVTIFWKGKPIASVDVSWKVENGQLVTSSGKWAGAGRSRGVGTFAHYLYWNFGVWEEYPSQLIRSTPLPWPKNRPNFKLPPLDQ
jgi:hypothetical protein